jgi:putative transposase
MARKLRVQYEGAIYHIMNRGDRGERIFNDDDDALLFLKTLGQVCAKTQWQVHAYCLMNNHFHLVVETPHANLSDGMKWFLGTYTSRFNRKNKLFGHLFSGRYKALSVDGSGNHYLRTVCAYVHLNPHRASLIKKQQSLKSYPWSSFSEFVKPPSKRPDWLRVDRVFGDLGIPKDSTAGRRRFDEMMEEQRQVEELEDFRSIRRGWCFGGEAFREELLDQIAEQKGVNHYGEEIRESLEAQALKIISKELKRRRLKQDSLSNLPKNHPAKIEIADQIRRETTMSFEWISRQLSTGTASYLSNLLVEYRKSQ